MRTVIFYTVLFLLTVSFAGQSQSYNLKWRLNQPQGNSLNDIASLGEIDVIAVGNFGTVLKSSDAGDTWHQVPSGITANITGIDVVTPSLLFIHALDVAANIRKSYKSSDGGATWELLPNQMTNAYYFDSKFYSPTSGIRVVDGTIQKTTNLGSSWQNLFSGLGSRYRIAFSDSLKFAVYMDYYNYAQTTDGGLTWNWKNFGRTCGFLEIKDSVIYALSDLYTPSSVYKSTNNGASWSSLFTIGDKVFKNLTFIDELTGYALACSNVYLNDSCDIFKTTNGGANWQKIYTGEYLASISSGSDGSIAGAGNAGKLTVSVNGGASWSDNNSNGTDFKTVCFPGTNTGFVGGIGGKLYKISNNGSLFARVNTNTAKDINCMIFTDSLNGWIAGGEGLLKRTSDGGDNWIDLSTGDAGFWAFSISRFISISNQPVLVLIGVGTNGWTTFISFDFGNTWIEKVSPVSQITCSSNGYFGTRGGRIYFYNESTNSWQLSSTGLIPSVKAIDVYRDANGVSLGMIAISGDGRIIFKEQNSTNWALKTNASFSASGIVCNGKGSILAYGTSGSILSTDSLTAVWKQEAKITNGDIGSVVFRTPEEFWAIGNDGIIFSGSTLSPSSVRLSLDTVPAFKSDPCLIYVAIDSIQSNITSASLTFYFPPGVSVLSVDTNRSLAGEQSWNHSSTIDGNSIRVDAAGTRAIGMKGIFLGIKFLVADTMQGKKYSVQPGTCSFNGGTTPFEISKGVFFMAKRGDVDTNGVVQAYDAALILKNLVGIYPLEKPRKTIADVTKDGTVSDMDAVFVLRYVVGIIDTLPFPGSFAAHGTISFGEVIRSAGGVIEVPVRTENTLNLAGVEMTIAFDDERFELLGITPTGLGDGLSVETSSKGGIIKIAGISPQSFNGSGNILKLKFRIKGTANGPGKISVLRVRLNENKEELNLAEIEIGTVSSAKDNKNLPREFSMSENYPNPFNPQTEVDFALPFGCSVSILIYNVLGEKVADLLNEVMPEGYHSVSWNAEDFPSGIYLIRLQAKNETGKIVFNRVRKMLLVK